VKLVGVDLGADEVRLARGERGLGGVRISAVERLPYERLATALPAGARVAVALPAAAATHRALTLPFRDRRRLARTVPLELLGHLAAEPADGVVAFDVLGPAAGGGVDVLAATVRRADVDAHLAPLARLGIVPARIDLAPLPLWHLLPGAPADAALVLADGARSALSVRRRGRLAGLRALDTPAEEADGFAAEVRWSLAALGGAPPVLVLAGPDAGTALAAALARALPARVDAVESVAGGRLPGGETAAACALAAGLVAGGGGGPTLAFAGAAREGLRLRRLGALAAAAVVLGAVDLGLVRHELVRRDAALAAAIRREATAVLPDASARAPRAALEAELAARGGRARGAGALGLLRELSVRVPAGLRLDLDELVVDPDELRLHGRAGSFEAVEALRRALAASPLLADVVADETRPSVDGRQVEFRVRGARRPAGGVRS
jgi:GspL periplasmic domain